MPSSRRPSRTRRLLLAALGVGFAALCTHCGPDEPAPEEFPQSRADRLRAKLEADTGIKWIVDGDRARNDVRVLVPTDRFVPRGSDSAARVVGMLREHAPDMGVDDVDARVGEASSSTDPDGATTVRVSIRHPRTGHRVLDREAVAIVANDGRLVSMSTPFRDDLPDVPSSAKVTEAEAIRISNDRVAAACAAATASAPSTVELGVDLEHGKLVYRLDYPVATEACAAPRVVVDATSGLVVAVRDTASGFMVKNHTGSRFHVLGETNDRKEISVSRPSASYALVSSDGPTRIETLDFRTRRVFESPFAEVFDVTAPTLGANTTLGAAIDAHYAVWRAANYFAEVHGWRGLDGKGAGVRVYAHAAPLGITNNAFFARGVGILVGDGNGGSVMPFGAALDVMGHEYAHGIIANANADPSKGPLGGTGESGAVNEAIADALGAAFEHALLPDEEVANLLFGERAHKPNSTPSSFRDLANPVHPSMPLTPCPDIKDAKGTVVGREAPSPKNDNCFVHDNGGVGTKAWAMMTHGGVGPKGDVEVLWNQRLGWEDSASLWFHAATHISAGATYGDLAATQVGQALSRWGLGSPQVMAVACAWRAVGAFHPLSLLSVVCPVPSTTSAARPPASSCQDVVDGLVCAESPTALAYVCKGGQISGSVVCGDLQKACAPGPGRKAATDAAGALVCQ